MRTLVLIGALALLLTVPAVAQDITPPPIPQLAGSVYPAAGGSQKMPLPTSVQFGLTLNKESGATVKAITLTVPRAVTLSAKGFTRCSLANARRGKCRARSFVGSGHLTLRVGPEFATEDYELTIYADGPRRVLLAFTGDDGIVAGPATIAGHRLRFKLPVALQKPARDKYAYLTNLRIGLGPVMARKRSFASLGSCRGGNHRYAAELTLAKNPNPPSQPTASATAASACRA